MNTTKEVKAVEKLRAKLNVICKRYKKKNTKIMSLIFRIVKRKKERDQ